MPPADRRAERISECVSALGVCAEPTLLAKWCGEVGDERVRDAVSQCLGAAIAQRDALEEHAERALGPFLGRLPPLLTLLERDRTWQESLPAAARSALSALLGR